MAVNHSTWSIKIPTVPTTSIRQIDYSLSLVQCCFVDAGLYPINKMADRPFKILSINYQYDTVRSAKDIFDYYNGSNIKEGR